MPKLPLVTIGIPTFERVEMLKQALNSALQQTYENLEIIVSDNASSDATFAFMQQINNPRVRYIRQESNLGMVGNWNACLAAARGDYFLLLSDDDLLEPRAIEILQRAYENETVALTYGRVGRFLNDPKNYFAAAKVPAIESKKELISGFLVQNRPTYACSMLFCIRDKTLFYDKSYRLLFDADFWIRYLEVTPGLVHFTNAIVAKYRKHPLAETSKAKKQEWQNEMKRLIESQAALFSDQQQVLRDAFFVNMSLGHSSEAKEILRKLKDAFSLRKLYTPSKNVFLLVLVRLFTQHLYQMMNGRAS
ncbi:MAG: glycosyltransferase family 2 protein [Deinococcales bacterium]